MAHSRPVRLTHIAGIGVDRMGSLADATARDMLRLENLDTDIPPDPEVIACTRVAVAEDRFNSYLPFTGQIRLRESVARHVSSVSGVDYGPDQVIVSAGGMSGILNVLLATIDAGDEVIVTDSTYAGVLNRIHLAGGVPREVPFLFSPGAYWKLDREALRSAAGPRTRAMLLMSPSMPSGAVLDSDDWGLVAEICTRNDLLLILDAAMERLLFDGIPVVHPAHFDGMAQRTIVVGSASKELRMIGWRVGWIVAPPQMIPDLTAVSIANAVVPVGIAQEAAALALDRSPATLPQVAEELQRRRDTLADALQGLPFGLPAGGWSMLLRVSDFGFDGAQMSDRLLEHDICATSMAGWGASAKNYIRLVFSNEPAERLRRLGPAVRAVI